jgi:DNA-binding CsgD family transcriptional regulator
MENALAELEVERLLVVGAQTDACIQSTLHGPLTETEIHVAMAAAAGRSNKEIAAALVVSVYTVERHPSRVYAKLGIRSQSACRPDRPLPPWLKSPGFRHFACAAAAVPSSVDDGVPSRGVSPDDGQ